jgi:UDP-N-acetylmuramoyl-L-alanyl-D-glutamate--2,6-diaminopimelate ligase
MRLADLLAGLNVQPIRPEDASVRICDITEDSRTAVPGSLFVARSGLKADGRAYVASAIEAGAVAILTSPDTPADAAWNIPVIRAADVPAVTGLIAERFHGNPSSKLNVIAVTGTNGKSTISYLVWKILNQAKARCGLIGTVITDDGREVARSSMTTPPAIELSWTLASMIEAGCTACSMEASSHALDQKRADALSIHIGIFTNLTGDHLDYHKTMEAYAAAKSRLFERLGSGGAAIVNIDDPWATRVAGSHGGRTIRCSALTAVGVKTPTGESVDASVEVLRGGVEGMTLRMIGPWGTIEASVPLIGRYNAMNVLQSVAACHVAGVATAEIERVLPALTAPPGRLERVLAEGTSGPRVYVDYAHSDDSLRNVLQAVRGAMKDDPTAGKLWTVFGCGGDRDRTKRPRMGAAASELSDIAVVTSDNPRSENPGAIVKEILAGVDQAGRERTRVHVERDQAIRTTILEADLRDVIVIAGKGHETEQIKLGAGGELVSTHFDDREHAADALRARNPIASTS